MKTFLLQLIIGEKADPAVIRQASDRIITSLRQGDELINALFTPGGSNYILRHLRDVSIVAGKIGLSLGYDTHQMEELVMAALIHDVGMFKVPAEILSKKGKLTPEEISRIKDHPKDSFQMVSAVEGLSPVIAEVVGQEHEREDGSGYPKQLKGDEIHEYAKIIGLSDIYVAMIQPRPQRGRIPPFEVIKDIIKVNRTQFPDYLIKAMINELSVFPVGVMVRLNTGDIGCVVRTNKLAPLRPVVKLIKDSRGHAISQNKVYDLMRENLIKIEDTFFQAKNTTT